jgi:hypothetical protein
MQHVDLKVLKPVAQLEAERLGAFDELGEIANAIDLAALAVIGMAKELGGEEGNLLANYLRDQAEGIPAFVFFPPKCRPMHGEAPDGGDRGFSGSTGEPGDGREAPSPITR